MKENRGTVARCVAAVMVCSAMGLSAASGQSPKQAPATLAELRNAIEAVLRDTRTPGAGIAIVSRDEVEWAVGLGVADVARQRAATADTLFRVGSISKCLVALVALKLAEEGRLQLSDTLRQWAPEIEFENPWEATDPVRLVHLLEHTTGFDDCHLREWAYAGPIPDKLSDGLAQGARSRVCRWRPGSRMAYCNSGPAVLAAVIEKATGQRFDAYVQENFFQPLGMDSAGYFPTPEAERRLSGLYRPDGATPYADWHFLYWPSGSLHASAGDMAKLVRFHLQRGSLEGVRLLQPASIARMETTESLPSAQLGLVAGYGLCNHAMPAGAFTFRGHGGAIPGGVSEMAYLPDAGRGYAVMINSGNGHALWRITRLIRSYLVRDLTPPPLPPPASVPAELQRHYGGYYQIVSPRDQWLYAFDRLAQVKRLTFRPNGLSSSTYGIARETWIPVSPCLFRKENQAAATLALLLDEEGLVLVECDGITFKKVSAVRIWSHAAGIGLVVGLVLSSVLFAPVWAVRMIFGKARPAGPLSVRSLPVLGSAFLIVFDLALSCGLRGAITRSEVDDLTRLGTPSPLSIAIMLSSLAFAAATAASLYVLFRARKTAMNRLVYWHALAVTGGLLAVALYYGYWGLIGVRLWA